MKSGELEKLKKKLPRGYRIEITRRQSGVSLKAIDAVLRGDYENEVILNTAIEIAEEYQSRIKSTKERINSL